MVFAFKNNVEKVLVLMIVALAIVTVFQWFSTDDLRDHVKTNERRNKELKEVNKDLEAQVAISQAEKMKLYKKIDSVEQQEEFYKTKYLITDGKLKKLLSDYRNADNATKNRLFTDAINN
jgi:peptidoglycan hydrolase CwlO-like protein